jgi:hypothetical protein
MRLLGPGKSHINQFLAIYFISCDILAMCFFGLLTFTSFAYFWPKNRSNEKKCIFLESFENEICTNEIRIRPGISMIG